MTEGRLITLDDAQFREIYRTFLYIRCPEAMGDIAEAVEVMPDADGILTYCTVGRDHGLTFYILCSGKTQDGLIELGPDVSDAHAQVAFDEARYYTFVPQKELGTDISRYEELLPWIGENVETQEKIPRMVCDLELLDRARNLEVPDCVSVVLQQEGLLPELIWTRVIGFGTHEIYGEVLQPPGQPGYGLEAGKKIGFRMMDFGEGITLMWDPALAME